jgi:hypothetical protein
VKHVLFGLRRGGARRAIFVTPVTATAGRPWFFEMMATILDVHEAIVRRMPPEEQRIVEEIIQEEMRRLRCTARRRRMLAELRKVLRRRQPGSCCGDVASSRSEYL